jgi:hypothetical protein
MLTSLPKLIVFGLLSKLGEKVVDQGYRYVSNKVREKTRAQITLSPAVYELISPWLFSLCKSNLIRYDIKNYSKRKDGTLEKTFSEGYYTADIDGIKCTVIVYANEENNSKNLTASINIPIDKIDKVKEIFEEKVKEAHKFLGNGLPVYTYNGLWQLSIIKEKRLKESLIYNGANPIDIVFDKIKQWQNAPKTQGANNTLGILLKGKPGSGKTTIASVIASELNQPLYILDKNLLNYAFASVSPNIVLLFDECDSHLSKRDENNKKEVSEILSLIDGPLTPPGLIVVYTTNNFDKLDPALLRPGRVDLIIDMDEYYEPPGVDIQDNFKTKN